MWALGMVLASVYFGNYPFPSETEYETIRAMVQIFGLPEAEVLHKAKNKAAFFTRDNSNWRLCTPEEYTETTGEQVEIKNHEESEAMKLIEDLDPDENNLIKFYECFSYKNVVCLVYDILDECLCDCLEDDDPTDLCNIRAIALQMFQALHALKSVGVVHGDIKLDNIMFAEEESLRIKLIDFGFAMKAKNLLKGTNIQVTPFRAPEVLLGLPLDESIDMWGLGVVLASLYYGNYPFPCETEYETIRAMVQIFGLPEEDLLNHLRLFLRLFPRPPRGRRPMIIILQVQFPPCTPMCRSVLGQDTEPHLASGGRLVSVFSSRAATSV
uniref:Protein kinase domain-containing protein n=1 Tax=Oryzias latipes TaxID=8090 RepID=A0A3B3H632_ORYLA